LAMCGLHRVNRTWSSWMRQAGRRGGADQICPIGTTITSGCDGKESAVDYPQEDIRSEGWTASDAGNRPRNLGGCVVFCARDRTERTCWPVGVIDSTVGWDAGRGPGCGWKRWRRCVANAALCFVGRMTQGQPDALLRKKMRQQRLTQRRRRQADADAFRGRRCWESWCRACSTTG